MKTYLQLLIVSLIFLSGVGAAPASLKLQAQETVTVRESTLDDGNYPNEVTFQIDVSGEVTSATLIYDVQQASCLEATTAVPVDIEGESIAWTWEMVRSGNPPPGTSVTWSWQLTDSNGQTQSTPPQTHTFSDGRYEWQTVTDGNLNLHWYEGEVGPTLLPAAVGALDRLETEMGIELQDEVNVFIYDNTDDMRDAVLYIQDWAGGVAFTEYNVILMGVPSRQATTWGQEVVPHELAHLVVAQFGRSCVGGSRPTWLDEGLAVYAEGQPADDIVRDIERGREENAFEPLRSLNGAFSAHGPEAGISYSQSYSVVDFMLDTYGRDKMRQFILTLADGASYDEALQQVYGFNVDGLEREWRTAVGAPPRAVPPTPTPIRAAAVPTLQPQGRPASVATPAAATTTAEPVAPAEPATGGSICSAAVVPLLLVGLVFGSRRRQKDRHVGSNS